MGRNQGLKGKAREELLDQLQGRYVVGGGWSQRLIYLRKKYSWILVVGFTRSLKRLVDIVGAAGLLLLLSPVFALISLLIKLHDGGPVLYVTDRVGKWGKVFPFPKFRSMVVNADKLKDNLLANNQHEQGVTFKIKNDPRVTWIGRIIRKTSLDELPQLWSVLIGDMSLVGPRPPLPREVAEYSLDDRRRLDLPPGITCIWQVSGRADIPFDRQVELDVQYIESQSFWTDFRILLKTVPAVILGKGAY